MNTSRIRGKNWGYGGRISPPDDTAVRIIANGTMVIFHKARMPWGVVSHPSCSSINVSGDALIIQYPVSNHWSPP